MTPKHYDEVAKWVERVALVVFTAFVIQNMVLEDFSSWILILGLLLSSMLYYMAYRLLLKS